MSPGPWGVFSKTRQWEIAVASLQHYKRAYLLFRVDSLWELLSTLVVRATQHFFSSPLGMIGGRTWEQSSCALTENKMTS